MQEALETRQIFINENDTLPTALKKLQTPFDESIFSNELSFVFNKKNNNYVGYYLLKGETYFYEIYFLPKIIKSDDNDRLTKFFNYLSQSYQLIEINSHETKITSSIKSIAFQRMEDTNTNKKNNIELLIFHQYKNLLEEIYSFFKRHSKVSNKQIHFFSQSISHKIDLKRNVTSLDKSRIHQSKIESIQYSDMALVAYGALRLFLYGKIEEFKDTLLKKQLEELTRSLISFLLQKFRLNRTFNIHFHSLLSNKSFRYFCKSQQSIDIYYHILSLFGYEPLLHKQDSDYCQLIKGNYFFFLPEKIYEFLVHEYFLLVGKKHKYELEIEFKPKEIYKTEVRKPSELSSYYPGVQDVAKATYNQKDLFPPEGQQPKWSSCFTNESEPDTVLSFKKNNHLIKVVIDAKWKILSNSLKAPDVLKLERDHIVHAAEKSILSYCKIDTPKLKNVSLKTKYTTEHSFEYRVIEVSFNLDTPRLIIEVDEDVLIS